MSVIVTGVQGGPLVARQEIRTMMQDVPLFTLYLLAVKRMQEVPENKSLSWFQIAGIHGEPNVIYDPPNGDGKDPEGYCKHSSPLFPGWHRPYLALFEQALATHVKNIANEYPATTRQKYVAAAQRFRIPYWDWAYYADPPDVVSKEKEFMLDTPTGPDRVDNPLLSYQFKQGSSRTLRWPTVDGTSSQPDRMDYVLNNQTKHTRDMTVKLLAAKEYSAFAQDRWVDPNEEPQDYLSLEQLHGLYHGLVGGGRGQFDFNPNDRHSIRRQAVKPEGWRDNPREWAGNMGYIESAAFDPMFWMHHANVDRLFAMWQALNPKAYDVWCQTSGEGNSDFMPFRRSLKPKLQYWTAAAVSDTRTFNYTYPELVAWESLGAAAKRDRLMRDISAMYRSDTPVAVLEPGLFSAVRASVRPIDVKAPSTFASRLAAAKETPTDSITSPGSVEAPPAPAANDALMGTSASASPPAGAIVSKQYNDWNANILIEKHSIKTSFFVHVFLGDFDPEPSNWLTDRNLVGSYYVFTTNIETTGCGNCKENAKNNVHVTGSVPLTGAILDSHLTKEYGKEKVATLDTDEMILFLRKELHWRVQTIDGSVIELKDIPSLKVSVVQYPATTPTNPLNFATKGKGVIHVAATTGRPGGLSEDGPTTKPSSGSTYDAKTSSGTNYGATNPPGSTYTPNPDNSYNSAAPPTAYGSKPSTNYGPKPTHGPGYVHKDCSCGAEIASDCSCKATKKTVVIDGRIREDVRRCSYEFDLPCNHFAVMYGVRTAIHEQIVNITIRRKSERKAYKDWSFEGKNDAGLLNLEGSRDAYNLNITPEAVDRVVVITFQSYSGGEYKSSDMRYKEVVISTDTSKQCSYFYTFFVEAGDDSDYHDTDFCVSVLPSKK